MDRTGLIGSARGLALAALLALVGTSLLTPPVAQAEPVQRPAAVPPAPKVGDCWVYASYEDAVEPSISPARKVSCTSPHNAVTTALARIPASIKNPWRNSETTAAAAGLSCDYRGYTSQLNLGLPMTRPLRVEGDYYVPSRAQWAAGQRWARCDTIIPNGTMLDDFPTNLTTWSADERASGRCYDDDPARGALVRRCDGTESWVAKRWVPMAGKAFPARSAFVKAANTTCGPLAGRQRQWNATWPKEINWAMGYRGVMCLVGPEKTSQ